jgi:dipeptidyl aminopeptidase/acylaminoacyl peptidase
MQIDDLFRFKRLADPQVSPDGKWVVYVQGDVDLEANKTVSRLWLASTDPKQAPKQLTASDKSDRHPRWSPDGKRILFESSRSGTNQLWLIALGGGEPVQLTKISTGASNGIWSRDGKRIAFVSSVWPEFSTLLFSESDAANKKRMEEREKNPVKAKVFTRLFFRHWDEYVEDKRQHLFVMDAPSPAPLGERGRGEGQPSNPAGNAAGSRTGDVSRRVGTAAGNPEPRDVTPGDRDAYPTSMTFSIGDDFTFSPDGKWLYFTAAPAKNEAWSTNYDVCRVPVSGGTTKWETVTFNNPAADTTPQFSPDGKWLAWRAQRRAGAEADRWEIIVQPADGSARPRSVLTDFDGSAYDYLWLPDSETIYFGTEHRATSPYYSVNIHKGQAKPTYISQHSNHSLSRSDDGKVMAFTRVAMHHPSEVYVSIERGDDFQVFNASRANAALLKELNLPRPESVTVEGAGGTPMQMWVLKPPGFDPKKKWPLVFLVHGGPQGAWDDGWSFRWNPQAWAAQGYVVALPNPRGSTGFGQKYVDEISGDWGGKVYEDLMAGLAWLEKQPWIDNQRMAAAGASYGGYMMNWFAVNTGKFKTLINHCGVWNFDSMYATTEELWFDEWEHGGPPWGKNRHSYEKHSPHRFAANLEKFRTPMLIIHNDLDFRVPISEGIQVFTTLQRLGVPSRFINFPDEGHWVLKPRNSQYWHREVFGWLKKHVAPGGQPS